MPALDLAARCRRLAREVPGDPMETALLRLAEECEAFAGRPLPTEPPDRPLPTVARIPVDPEHSPGTSAPRSGTYQLLNVMGSPDGTRVQVQEDEALPPAPFGWTWRLVVEDGKR